LLLEVKNETLLKDRDLFLDKNKLRIILSKKNLTRNLKEFKKLGLVSAVVKEYPNADQLEMEVEMLG
jgi:hypothetical protein